MEMCKRLGVGVTTFKAYKHRYPKLVKALKDGKEEADFRVENSLYKRAMGYDVIETTREAFPVAKMIMGKPLVVPVLTVTKEEEKERLARCFSD